MRKFIFILILLILSSSVTADFWTIHDWADEQALEMQPSSDFKEMIKDGREDIYRGCNLGSDFTVYWYITAETRKNYQQSHKIRAFERCNDKAGSDKDLKVCCLSMGSHQTQDPTSHGFEHIQGSTPICIEEYWGSNVLFHAGCENAKEEQFLETIPETDRVRLLANSKTACKIFEDENPSEEGYQNKFFELFAYSFEFTTAQQKEAFEDAMAAVCQYTGEGEKGGYSNLWKEKSSVPTQWGRNRWKWVLSSYYLIIILMAGIFFYSAFESKAYAYFRVVGSFTPTLFFGYAFIISLISAISSIRLNKLLRIITLIIFIPSLLFSSYVLVTTNFGKIVIDDHMSYINKAADDTHNFLMNGELRILDASGLDYTNKDGIQTQGKLTFSERKFFIVTWMLYITTFAFVIIMSIQSMIKPKKRK
jgi:hypothetical protein